MSCTALCCEPLKLSWKRDKHFVMVCKAVTDIQSIQGLVLHLKKGYLLFFNCCEHFKSYPQLL